MATFNPEFCGIGDWHHVFSWNVSHLRVFIQLRGRRVKSDSACLIETLKELQREAEQSPETWPKPPTETETEISHGHTVTSEQRLLFTVTAADRSTSPPALHLHTTVVHRRDVISLLEMWFAELRDKTSESWPTGCEGDGIFHCWCGSVWWLTPYRVCIFFAFQLFQIWLHTYLI